MLSGGKKEKQPLKWDYPHPNIIMHKSIILLQPHRKQRCTLTFTKYSRNEKHRHKSFEDLNNKRLANQGNLYYTEEGLRRKIRFMYLSLAMNSNSWHLRLSWKVIFTTQELSCAAIRCLLDLNGFLHRIHQGEYISLSSQSRELCDIFKNTFNVALDYNFSVYTKKMALLWGPPEWPSTSPYFQS